MSSPEDRIEDETNHYLFSLIPVVYGAVFSYAMYIFSLIIITAYNEWDLKNYSSILQSTSLKEIVLFISFTVYMIEDIGSIMKLGNLYPFKRTSRYTFEIFIALLYICSYSLLNVGIYYCVVAFAILVGLGGIWHNQFKEEYIEDDSNVKSYSKNERDLHYIGSFCLIVEIGIIIAAGHTKLDWINVSAFVVALFLWMFITAKWICFRHGDEVLKCRMMIFLPDHYVRKICKKQTTLTINQNH